MKRKKQNLDGLSLPINSFAVVLQLLSILGGIAAFLPCLHFMANPLLWSSVAVFGIGLVLLILFKGFPLFVFYSRFVLGFSLVCLALVQASSMDQLEFFLRTACDEVRIPNNPLGSLAGNASAIAFTLVVLEFVVGIALLVGAWIRFISVGSLFVLAFYAWCFWNLFHLNHLNVDESGSSDFWNFKLDHYLTNELTNTVCFVFVCSMIYIVGLSIAFGHKIYANSVKLNWYLLPILCGLAALLSVLLHWYTPLFFIPLTLISCLLIYRSGGRFFANAFGELIVALVFIICFVKFQKPLGIDMKARQEIAHKNKPSHRND